MNPVWILAAAAVAVVGCKETKPPADDPGFPGEKTIRPMRKAGTWYPRDADTLGTELDRYLVAARVGALDGRLVGLISPHAGYRFSGPTAAYGFKALGKQRGVRRVVVLGVSHHHRFRGVSIPDVTHYATPFGLLRVDPAAAKLRKAPGFTSLRDAHRREHSVEMQLPLLKRVRPKARIVPMVVGQLDDALLAQLAAHLAPLADSGTVFLASSDFTHRGGHFRFEVRRQGGESLRAAVKRLDFGTLPFIRELNGPGLRAYRRKTGITMCGRDPVALMLAALKRARINAHARVLHYATSGDVTGSWRSTVSYLSVALTARKARGAP